jgi:hypothetical protein
VIGIRPPSVQREYDDFWSGDPAIKQPPQPPPENASDEERDRYIKSVEDYVKAIELARETGDWRPLIIEGETPTKFTLRPLPAKAYTLLADMSTSGAQTRNQVAALAFQCALARLSNLGKAELKQVRHAELGLITSLSFFDDVGVPAAIALQIIQEIGGAAIARAARPPQGS